MQECTRYFESYTMTGLFLKYKELDTYLDMYKKVCNYANPNLEHTSWTLLKTKKL